MKQVNGSFEVIDTVESTRARARRRTSRSVFATAFACALTAVSIPACAEREPVAVFPSGAEFSIELAVDTETRARGYMYREKVGRREGMLFLFETTEHHSFWMKNCKVPLDIIWLDETFHVAHIAHNAPPCPERGECRNIQPMRAGRYVLEVAGGTARREGLERGDSIVVLADGIGP